MPINADQCQALLYAYTLGKLPMKNIELSLDNGIEAIRMRTVVAKLINQPGASQ